MLEDVLDIILRNGEFIVRTVIQVVLAIIGWRIAFRQFKQQQNFNISQQKEQMKRSLQVEVVKDLREYVEKSIKSNVELSVALSMLSEGIWTKLKHPIADYKVLKEGPQKLNDLFFEMRTALSNVLFFFDHRQYAKSDVQKEISELKERISEFRILDADFSDQFRIFYFTKYKPENYNASDIEPLDGKITELLHSIDKIISAVENISNSVQEKYIEPLFNELRKSV